MNSLFQKCFFLFLLQTTVATRATCTTCQRWRPRKPGIRSTARSIASRSSWRTSVKLQEGQVTILPYKDFFTNIIIRVSEDTNFKILLQFHNKLPLFFKNVKPYRNRQTANFGPKLGLSILRFGSGHCRARQTTSPGLLPGLERSGL